MTYFLSVEAEQELAEAINFYEEHASKTVASAMLEEFVRAAALLEEHPELGVTTLQGRRMFPLHRFPYSLIYRVAHEGITISAVAHQRRRPNYWQTREI